MLRRRLITGPILILLLVLLGWLDGRLAATTGQPGLVMAALAAAILVPLAAWEAASMVRATTERLCVPVAIVSAVILYLSLLFASRSATPAAAAGSIALGPGLVVALAFIAVIRGGRVEGGFVSVAGTLLVATWTGLFIGFWVLTTQRVGAAETAGLILVVKASDIGAYTVGMLAGRRKLIPWLSPGKTIEGGFGAILGGAIAGLAFAAFVPSIPWWVGVLLGSVLAVVAAMGDLFESLLKREAGWKDSGRILPGMGGVLDVLDSLLLAGPVVWAFVWMIG